VDLDQQIIEEIIMGFFRQLLSIGPANGVITRFNYAFETAVNNPQAEPYGCLVCAWNTALEPYEKGPEASKNPDKIAFGAELALYLSTSNDLETSAKILGTILACIHYPSFVNVPQNRPPIECFIKMMNLISSNPEKANQVFALQNPIAFDELSVQGVDLINSTVADGIQMMVLDALKPDFLNT
jgi:hypothetical protein